MHHSISMNMGFVDITDVTNSCNTFTLDSGDCDQSFLMIFLSPSPKK